MSDAIETIEYKNHTIEILPDMNPESPREWDNICEFHCGHRRYNLGDFHYTESTREDFNEMYRKAKRQNDIILPLYMYEHSGIALSIQSFYRRLPQGHAEFDSCQVGYVIIRREKVLEEWGKKRITKQFREKLIRIAESEIQTYNQYLRGDIYGYNVIDEDGNETDSCWGYYGTEDAITEAKSIVDYKTNEVKV